jgi:hypothetical protein
MISLKFEDPGPTITIRGHFWYWQLAMYLRDPKSMSTANILLPQGRPINSLRTSWPWDSGHLQSTAPSPKSKTCCSAWPSRAWSVPPDSERGCCLYGDPFHTQGTHNDFCGGVVSTTRSTDMTQNLLQFRLQQLRAAIQQACNVGRSALLYISSIGSTNTNIRFWCFQR